MGTTPPITTNNPQNTRSTKPDQATVPAGGGAWPQYPQTTEIPSPSKFRMQFPRDTDRCMLKNRGISTIRFQYLKYAQGNCMRNCRDPVRTRAIPRPGRAGVEGVGRAGGPGCGARGWRRGLAGLRGDAPSEARGADGSRAGRRPRAHHAARPTHHAARPKQPGTHTAQTAYTARGPKRRSASGPSRVSVAHRLSWMLRPGTASISSRV